MTWIEGKPEKVTAGMTIETSDGEVLLVGDINLQEGFCGCCSLFPSTIIRYKEPTKESE